MYGQSVSGNREDWKFHHRIFSIEFETVFQDVHAATFSTILTKFYKVSRPSTYAIMFFQMDAKRISTDL